MHPPIIIGIVRSLIVDVAVWGRYRVPQNVFPVSHTVDYENYFPGKSSYSHSKLEIRSVERGICPIVTSTINERTVTIIMAGCMAHEREGYISTSGLKSDVTIVFLDPDFL